MIFFHELLKNSELNYTIVVTKAYYTLVMKPDHL
jgi:hypothetical protein